MPKKYVKGPGEEYYAPCEADFDFFGSKKEIDEAPAELSPPVEIDTSYYPEVKLTTKVIGRVVKQDR